MGHGIKWTDSEKAKLRASYLHFRREVELTQEAALIEAQRGVLSEDRRRNTKNTTSKLLRDIGIPPEKPRDVIEKSVKAKASKPNGVKSYVARRKVESKVAEPELPTLESALSTLISVIAHEVVGAVGLQLMATVKESGAQATAQMMREFRQKMSKLHVPATPPQQAQPELTERQSVQNITVRTTEAMPENLSRVVVAPKDRKPKVLIFGLIRQQVLEIKAEFGTICDLSFIQSDDAVKSDVRGKDLAFIMTKFSKHNAELICKSNNVPFYRITGGVSHLRLEMRKWINGEVALTEVEA